MFPVSKHHAWSQIGCPGSSSPLPCLPPPLSPRPPPSSPHTSSSLLCMTSQRGDSGSTSTAPPMTMPGMSGSPTIHRQLLAPTQCSSAQSIMVAHRVPKHSMNSYTCVQRVCKCTGWGAESRVSGQRIGEMGVQDGETRTFRGGGASGRDTVCAGLCVRGCASENGVAGGCGARRAGPTFPCLLVLGSVPCSVTSPTPHHPSAPPARWRRAAPRGLSLPGRLAR